MTTNTAIALLAAMMAWTVGAGAFFMIQLPVVALGASAGVWLFFVQHQFDPNALADR